MKKYFPILLSKAGELAALSKLSPIVKNEISPILQVLPNSIENIKKFVSEWNFTDNELFLDFSLYGVDLSTIRRFISDLVSLDINVVPVLQSNSKTIYIDTLERLFLDGEIEKVGFRFSNNSGGFININDNINDLLSTLSISESQVSLILDFGLVDENNYNTFAALAINLIRQINNSADYDNLIVASGSFLENLTSLTPAGKLYKLPRYEWDIWNSILAQSEIANNIKYSDYGTKYPYYTEANFQGSCSVKYTTEKEYVIYRGELSGNHQHGNGQYITFANRLSNSNDYSGEAFSWGDERVKFYAEQDLNDSRKKTGNAGNWVEISQNHHMTLIHSIL